MDTQEFVCNIPYFDGLSESEHQSIKALAIERHYERGDIIIYEGDKATALYVVCSGAVKIFKTSLEGKEQILSIARPGDSFNDVGVFDEGLNPASAQAMGEAVIYELGRSELNVITQNHPIVAHNTIKVLAEQVRELVTLVEDLSFRHVIGRVAKILLEYAGTEVENGPRLTQQEMAAMAGSAREVVGRSLKTLEENGLIKLNRHKVIITDIHALREMVEEPV
ncbi:MAG TPA: Crp/Fnr family transcriptional regulator [Dehalococcoidia bacterium]|nr:Crp/Fnr family transcriptional regulator [Dehalococcoidia bacterium]